MSRLAILFLAFAFAIVAATDIKFDEGDDNVVVLTSFGEETTYISVLYRGPDAPVEFSSESSVISAGEAEETQSSRSGYTNFTIPLTFRGVGSGDFRVTIREVSVTGRFVAAGFVILRDGQVVSGEDGEVSVGQAPANPRFTYEVRVVNTDGSTVDISDTRITLRSIYKEVDLTSTTISSEQFVLVLNDYRVGTGEFKLEFETEAITLNGDSFETVLNVRQDTTPPPCVALGGSVTTASDGTVSVSMFNLLKPPRSSDVESVVITIDGESTEWNKERSDLQPADQTVVFETTAAGTASITCDGEPAVIIGGDLVVSGSSVPSEPLASGIIAASPSSDDKSVFNVTLENFRREPENLTAKEAQAWVDLCCRVTDGESCVLTDVRKGSAIMDIAGLVDEGEAEKAESEIDKCFEAPDCPCQKEMGYECDDVVLKASSFNVVGSGSVAAAGGLATWTIVLIAVVGAFALILVMVLGLWAVYRRSSDHSESEYSSSGPLGVPDPSDLLYAQSIVRDIYGRGDFPDGGPSQAVAEQRAREAEMREEFPRPPSSSGLSRGANTDDASSTYSV